jgi:hypothetical protein
MRHRLLTAAGVISLGLGLAACPKTTVHASVATPAWCCHEGDHHDHDRGHDRDCCRDHDRDHRDRDRDRGRDHEGDRDRCEWTFRCER